MTEKQAFRVNGFLGILVIIALISIGVYLFVVESQLVLPIVLVAMAVVLATGIVIVQPNQAQVITFFGQYMGSIRQSGLHLTIPLVKRDKVSLRVRNFTSSKLKVNDVQGNPIEIAAVIVYKVVDSAQAIFNVDNYEEFVGIQSEAGIRHIASKYPYDNFSEEGISLRENTETVVNELVQEVQDRLNNAGVNVLEARITHLAYSAEIANAMLQRQQAQAIVAARRQIVEGAVGMAQLAIAQLEQEGIIELDDERKVQMINNLMVAIVSERGMQPVVNTGTLY
jgi:regulator of protease activity HflC (stomatin/prohibitin superfamily)